jgi:hypothetical protein
MGTRAESDTAQPLEWHPAAGIFPMLPEDKLMELADDIEKNGQREAILILDGKILDGRNRSCACQLKGIKPVTKAVTGIEDPVAYVLSLNLHRRHLTPSQASMCAARARELYEQQAKERLNTKGGHSGPVNLPEAKADARDAAGKAFGVSGKSVDFAKKVIDKGIPELAKAVDEGRMAVSTAAVLASEPKEIQKAEVDNPLRNRKYTSAKGGGKQADEKPENKPRHKGEHSESEVFAIGKADVAIAQLKGIPSKNQFRIAALDRVLFWIESQKKGNRQ